MPGNVIRVERRTVGSIRTRKKAGVADVIEIIRGWQQFFGRPDFFPACISKAQEKKDKRDKGALPSILPIIFP